ncbi:Mariner Mos1 transposase [Acromyrmex echinatior]|uniref:Mariner Mos1 transposase n=1 Tax=Acromyrmex echinatior TaxID=103372 RepID=F4X5Z6_ACREC|nr:Mariner Mos1 transposase [Acromyrmex echinatior]
MSKFVPNKEHSRTVLIFCFHLKKTAAESYRLLREAYGEHDPSQDICERWFRRFKSGDFDVADKEHGKPSKSTKM